MSGLHLPPAEPPDESLAWLREQRDALDEMYRDAQDTLQRLTVELRDHERDDARMVQLTIEVELATTRVRRFATEAQTLAQLIVFVAAATS